MISKCKILNFNKKTGIVVADFDGVQIQFTVDIGSPIGAVEYIKKLNSGGYQVVDKAAYDKAQKKKNEKDIIEKHISEPEILIEQVVD